MKLSLLDPSKDLAHIKSIWTELSTCAQASYFMSWGWMANWLSALPSHALPQLAVFCENNTPIIAFFIKPATILRHHVFRSRGLFVNSTGNSLFDNIWIEYNQFLYRSPLSCSLNEILALLPEPWDELFLPGIDLNAFPGDSLETISHAYHLVTEETEPSPYVDLRRFQDSPGDYLAFLSSNTRSQIRRSYRLYQTRGPIMADVARNQQEARRIFAELIGLHRKVWQARGTDSPFLTPFVLDFHAELIESRFDKGEIQLLRIRSGGSTIGCLYAFVYNGRVYFYQSGFNYEADKRLKPGLVAHSEAIKYNIEAGNSAYDFLGGISRYKTSLATRENQLAWVKIQKSCLKFALETKLRSAKHSLMRSL